MWRWGTGLGASREPAATSAPTASGTMSKPQGWASRDRLFPALLMGLLQKEPIHGDFGAGERDARAWFWEGTMDLGLGGQRKYARP